MKKLISIILAVCVATATISIASKADSGSWLRNITAISTAVVGALILVTSGVSAYEDYKKEQVGSITTPQGKQSLERLQIDVLAEEKKLHDKEANLAAINNAINEKLKELPNSLEAMQDYIRKSSLIFTTILKYTTNAKNIERDLIYYLETVSAPQEHMYQELNGYLRGALASENPDALAQQLTALWVQDNEVVENFLEKHIKVTSEAAATSLGAKGMQQLGDEIKRIR